MIIIVLMRTTTIHTTIIVNKKTNISPEKISYSSAIGLMRLGIVGGNTGSSFGALAGEYIIFIRGSKK
jgi:hypothetical protein